MNKVIILCMVLGLHPNLNAQCKDKTITGVFYTSPQCSSLLYEIFTDSFALANNGCEISPYTQAQPIITEIIQASYSIKLKSKGFAWYQIDSSYEYSGNELIVRNKVLNDKVIDLGTKSGLTEACYRLSAIVAWCSDTMPSLFDLSDDQSLTVYTVGWFRLANGINFRLAFNNTPTLFTGKNRWSIYTYEETGTVVVNQGKCFFLGHH